MTRKRVAILISGRGSNMAALIEAAKAPDYPAEIALVLSNIADAAGLARAREAGIATEVVDHKPFGKDREAFDRAMQAVLERHTHRHRLPCGIHARADAVVRRALERAHDQHPPVPAAGLQGPRHRTRARLPQARRRTARRCTSSCRNSMPGPIIAQESVPVLPGDTPDTLAARVLEVEHRIYPLALRRVAEGAA